jgi:hypothetical protein
MMRQQAGDRVEEEGRRHDEAAGSGKVDPNRRVRLVKPNDWGHTLLHCITRYRLRAYSGTNYNPTRPWIIRKSCPWRKRPAIWHRSPLFPADAGIRSKITPTPPHANKKLTS